MQNFYLPKKIKILEVFKETPDTKTFLLDCKRRFNPGQFFMVGIPGVGESPISISGADGRISFTIKQTGCVTAQIHKLKKDDALFIRGPFGNGFDIDLLKKKDILVVAGGLGIAPLKPLISHVLKNRKDFLKVYILYGARSPQDIVFKKDFKRWLNKKDIKILLTVDNATSQWEHAKGVVTALFKKIKIIPQNTIAVICGPPIMMRYSVFNLLEMRLDASQIILSLERHMKCGIGKCGHCYLGEKFVCLDGPVFRYSELLKLRPEIELA